MRILFLHRNFPAQFRHLATYLAQDKNNEVLYLTNRKDFEIQGIKKFVYDLHRETNPSTHHYMKFYEESILHGQGALRAALQLREQGFFPDVIIGHSWGASMFIKDVYPEVPYIAHIEWFYNAKNSDIDFISEPDIDFKAKTRVRNSHLLVDLYSCNKVITPTKWQLAQIPEVFHDKISVVHEGIDTEFFKPDENAVFNLPGLSLTSENEVLTYATRGMEPYRGFPQFMEAVSAIQKRRPNCHIVVAGDDRICYGPKLPEGKTFKGLMLEKFDFDYSRLHFTGTLPYSEYVKLLQISAAHIYLTYPFVLSWSMLEAMACGRVVLASNTPPVKEVIEDNFNGILFNFFSPAEIIDKVDEILENRDKFEHLRINARETIIKNYDLKNMLQKQLNLINDVLESHSKSINADKIRPLLIQTIIGEEKVCARVRVSEPNRFSSLIPGVKTVEAIKTADLSIGNSYKNKVFIWQRIWPQTTDQQKQILSRNYLVISEMDDDPLRWEDYHKMNNFFAFRSCHGIQTSTEPLAEFLRQYNPNVAVFRNHLAYLPPVRTYNKEKVTIFFGALNREEDWKPIISSLNNIISDYYDKINVKVIHDKQFFDSLNTINKEFMPFSPYNVYEKILRECDIAVLPLECNHFNSMKSDLKFIESAGHGVTVLASPTVYGDTIDNGKTGFIYNSVQEFEEKLVELIEKMPLRHEIAKNAYNYVSENRLLSRYYKERADWYYKMIDNLPKLNEELKYRAPELFS